MESKVYRGQRTLTGAVVTVNGSQLNPRNDLHNHSPDGFEWGYGGSGPAQLALALLADHTGDDNRALADYQTFKFAVVAGLSKDTWTMTSDEIERVLAEIQSKDVSGPQ